MASLFKITRTLNKKEKVEFNNLDITCEMLSHEHPCQPASIVFILQVQQFCFHMLAEINASITIVNLSVKRIHV